MLKFEDALVVLDDARKQALAAAIAETVYRAAPALDDTGRVAKGIAKARAALDAKNAPAKSPSPRTMTPKPSPAKK